MTDHADGARIFEWTDNEDPAELRRIVSAYGVEQDAKLFAMVGACFDADLYLERTMSGLGKYLMPLGGTWIARLSDDQIIGVVFVTMIRPDVAEMKRLFVLKRGRGMGLGRGLIKRTIDRARDLGARRLVLDTGDWMPEAQALYRAIGFEYCDPYPEAESAFGPIANYIRCMALSLDR